MDREVDEENEVDKEAKEEKDEEVDTEVDKEVDMGVDEKSWLAESSRPLPDLPDVVRVDFCHGSHSSLQVCIGLAAIHCSAI